MDRKKDRIEIQTEKKIERNFKKPGIQTNRQIVTENKSVRFKGSKIT